jgi:hypothetical protein
MGQYYSTAYEAGGTAVFYGVTTRLPIKDSMNILVGTYEGEELTIKPPRQNILEDLMSILEAQYGGILAVDLNHCIFFMDKAGILDFAKIFPLIVFIPLKDNRIEAMYKELSRNTKEDPDAFTQTTQQLYSQMDRFLATAKYTPQ